MPYYTVEKYNVEINLRNTSSLFSMAVSRMNVHCSVQRIVWARCWHDSGLILAVIIIISLKWYGHRFAATKCCNTDIIFSREFVWPDAHAVIPSSRIPKTLFPNAAISNVPRLSQNACTSYRLCPLVRAWRACERVRPAVHYYHIKLGRRQQKTNRSETQQNNKLPRFHSHALGAKRRGQNNCPLCAVQHSACASDSCPSTLVIDTPINWRPEYVTRALHYIQNGYITTNQNSWE